MIQTLIYRDNRFAGANPPDEQLAAPGRSGGDALG
jgi:hypothetical protein